MSIPNPAGETTTSETLRYCDKPGHSGVPMIQYGDRAWCRFCENNRHESLTVLRNSLLGCQWGAVLSVPLAVLGAALLSPLTRGADGALSRDHWLALVPTGAFLTAMIVSAAGHKSIRNADSKSNGALGTSRWYHPTQMLRDWIVIGLVIALPYWALLKFGTSLPVVGQDAGTFPGYLLHRAPVLALITAIILPMLNGMGAITPNTLLPQHGGKGKALFGYGIATALLTWAMMQMLSHEALQNYGSGLLLTGLSLTAFFVLLYLVVLGLARAAAQSLTANGGRPALPVPASIAMVGPSNVGKTVFLARAYSEMESNLFGMMSIEPTEESKRYLNPIIKRMEEDREWPFGTTRLEISDVPFHLRNGIDELVLYRWLDLPGASFTDPDNPDYADAVAYFDLHLQNSDAVIMMLDARDLEAVARLDQLSYIKIYRRTAERLFKRLREVGKGARPVPLAIVITQTSRANPASHNRLREMAKALETYWIDIARQCGVGRPETRIYLSSAVYTPYVKDASANDFPDRSKQLTSRNTRQPLFWMAGQVLRQNISVMDTAAGFAVGSALQQLTVKLEMSADRADPSS